MATKEEPELLVESFLRDLAQKMKYFDIAFRPRDKNLEALSELDITADQRIEYLLNLKVENYCSGPNKDTFDPTKPDLYEFGIQIKGKEVYIKISLGLFNKRVDCMSFHPAEFPMKYLLKTK